MIKLKNLLNEASEQEILNNLKSLYKDYHKLLELMYGPDGTETKYAVALVSHLGKPTSLSAPATLMSPEMKKAQDDNKALMKQMGELGQKMHNFYQQLVDIGKEDIVKKMRDFQRKETEKYILDLTDQSILKQKADAKNMRDELENAIEKKHLDYQNLYKKWLSGTRDTPPPLPPTITTKL